MRSTILSALVAGSIATTAGSAWALPGDMRAGFNVDLSVPSGAAVGVDVSVPYLPFVKAGISATYLLSPGVRGSLLIDPIPFFISPVLDLDLGYQSPFTIPSVHNSPSVSYNYVDLQGGLALGSQKGFRFLVLAGATNLAGSATNVSGLFTLPNGATIGNPTFNVWCPSAKLGVVALF